MPRELPSYRDNLEDILSFFGGKRMLTVTDVSKYLGLSREVCRNRFGLTKDGISAPSMARKLAQLSD